MKHPVTYIIAAAFLIVSVATLVQADENKYQVVKGDSLLRIAEKFGIPFREIMAANNLKNTTIYTGQILQIPTTGEVEEKVEEEKDDVFNPIRELVKPAYRETEPEVYVKPTGTIDLPTYREEGPAIGTTESNTYIVQQGDTVRSISRKFGMKPSDLRRINKLGLTRLYSGQILRVPSAD